VQHAVDAAVVIVSWLFARERILSSPSSGGIPTISTNVSFVEAVRRNSGPPEVGVRRSSAHLDDEAEAGEEREARHANSDAEDSEAMPKYSSCRAGNHSGDGEADRPIERGRQLPKAASMALFTSGGNCNWNEALAVGEE
jgi:hypothetical protein